MGESMSQEIEEALNNLMTVLFKEGKTLDSLVIDGHPFVVTPEDTAHST